MDEIFAHSANQAGKRHHLSEHLRAVAGQATQFAAGFGGEEAARYLGLWHDVGKASDGFQDYLASCEANPQTKVRGPDHKAAGALLSKSHFLEGGLLIQGHHGGLRSPSEYKFWLADRGRGPGVDLALERARALLPELEPGGQIELPGMVQAAGLAGELFLRLLFSALVDADFLDTERHFRPDLAESWRMGVKLEELWRRFDSAHARFSARPTSPVDEVRREVYESCLRAAEAPPGMFRLTVPTGGGKTLSSMAFALRHALKNGQRRVVVAVPFITITEQTADVYRGVFGERSDGGPIVLEHHSGGSVPEEEEFHAGQVWARLAAENWDAPVVVTTTVQLFESLFANGTRPARKLHRLARSVIILDEAQALPAGLLAPILDALKQLCVHFGTTVVISTATQPAFEAIPAFANLPTTEIVPQPARLFHALRRVRYEWRTDSPTPMGKLADALRLEQQGLAVLNTKRDALRLLDALEDPDALHLSTLLCGAHRRAVLKEIRRRLDEAEPCRLVSTQVVEAGVDIDFPLVLRALGPLDAIIQSAGRCNREGRRAEGRVVVFVPEDGGLPFGVYRPATGVTRALLGTGPLDLDDPKVPGEYFRRLFQTVPTDQEGIQKLRARLDFPEVARRFRMIPEETESLVVHYGSEAEQAGVDRMVTRLRQGAPEARLLLRRLQPYLVSVYAREAERYRRVGLVEDILPGLGRWLGPYDGVRGLWNQELDPEDLVV